MEQEVDRIDEVNPDISVIIPMYNTEKYIGQCLKTLLAQTFRNFEIICVDDGSLDNTRTIVEEYKNSDNRISLIQMSHCGKAGVMRNEGMKYARGEYCLFLDSDDFFEAEMLEKTLCKTREDEADICLFDARLYNEKTKKYKEIDYIIQKEYCPVRLPFEGRSNPYIFNITSGCPWSKLIKRSLIEKNQLQFMELRRSNDVYFVFLALAMAERITVLPEVFVNYRQSGDSLQANNASSPWDWYEALKALMAELKRRGIYDDVELSFRNLAFGVSIYNLCSLKTAASFTEVYDQLRNRVFEEFSLDDFSEEECYSYNKKKYAIYSDIIKYNVDEYLFNELSRAKQEKSYWVNRAKKVEAEIKEIKGSTTYKIGRKVRALPGKIRKLQNNNI